MKPYVLTIWLMAGGHMITIPVDDCYGIGAAWYVLAVQWAERSGIAEDGPGYMCGRQDEQQLWRVNR